MKQLDIRKTDEVVCYDTNIMLGGCRAYWMFRVFGLKVQLLENPLAKWISEGRQLDT